MRHENGRVLSRYWLPRIFPLNNKLPQTRLLAEQCHVCKGIQTYPGFSYCWCVCGYCWDDTWTWQWILLGRYHNGYWTTSICEVFKEEDYFKSMHPGGKSQYHNINVHTRFLLHYLLFSERVYFAHIIYKRMLRAQPKILEPMFSFRLSDWKSLLMIFIITRFCRQCKTDLFFYSKSWILTLTPWDWLLWPYLRPCPMNEKSWGSRSKCGYGSYREIFDLHEWDLS